ncbi:glycosyltransferase family 2 protein [Planctomycetes bacterium K23_9]|uniref:GNT-I family protein n=1 Tax=Stieleria marina TaxID=1930275 RepID=A0A517NMK4_9BACT|nr:hypothetical protein K239x_02980 [Planctomycetes bacterium K23_9]
MLDVPVAFVIFNRPEATRHSFASIRRAQPSRLFLISDAPRPNRDGEVRLVQQSRDIAEGVDWECDVTQIYAEQNMGCGRRISSGISQAFAEVDRLIILEDDCVADDSFFDYCDGLLDRYQADERVMAVTGNNFQQGHSRTPSSYYFSKYPHCWGWATWRRAWDLFDLSIANWPTFRDTQQLQTICHSAREIQYWTRVFDQVHAGDSHSWAFPWTLSCWMNHGLTAIPDVNLVSNIGFGVGATHTQKVNGQATLPTHALGEIVHPTHVQRNYIADQFTDDHVFSGNGRRRTMQKIENAFRKLRRSA